MSTDTLPSRVGWVDIAKGVCILLVVLMHATLGVEKATGEATALNGFIEWAKPFRMPDFFLISGLFLAARINRPWPSYLDTKVVHFAYFYVLWLTIQFAVKSPGMIAETGAAATVGTYLLALVQPWGTLWFIYLLAVFFVTAKLLAPVPKLAVWSAATILYMAMPHTGILAIDEFASRFVFFYTGYAAASYVFQYASWIEERAPALIALTLVVWSVLNLIAVESGWAFVTGIDLAVSYIGVAAVIAFSVLAGSSLAGRVLGYCGHHSIAIYLAFPLFMGPARIVALKLGDTLPGWSVALASASAGVLGALLLAHIVSGTRLAFLFERPAQVRLDAVRLRFSERARRAATASQTLAGRVAAVASRPAPER